MAAKKKKIERWVAFGASEVAVAGLEALREEGFVPELLVTRRVVDPESGERTRLSPARKWARKHEVKAIHPEDHKEEEWLEPLLADPPDLALSIGWSVALPEEILQAPRLGCVGLHASNLPKHRGPHPVRAVLAAGESSTGVTVFRIEGGNRSGPVLRSESLDISANETYGELMPRVAELTGQVLVETVQALAAGKKLKEKKQSEARGSSSRIDRRHRRAPWWLTAKEVYNRLRAYSPEPGLETFIRTQRVEILGGKPVDWMSPTFGDTGTYLGLRGGRVAVLCNQSTIFGIERLRKVGGKAMSASNYARENDLSVGSSFV